MSNQGNLPQNSAAFPSDFRSRLVDAMRLKEFAIEYGCQVPDEVLNTLNGLASRTGFVECEGSAIPTNAAFAVSEHDVSALDKAIMLLNSCACPTTLSIFSRPSNVDLFEYFRRGLPDALAQEKSSRGRERFYWLIVLMVLFDAFVFQGMSTWTGPLIIGTIEIMAVVAIDRGVVDRLIEALKKDS
jgi:hypothetical protein